MQAQHTQSSSSNDMTWMLQLWHGLDLQSTVQSMQVNAGNSSRFTRIDALRCILTYDELLGNRSDFIMISTTTPKSNNSLLAYGMSTSATWDIGYPLCSDGGQFDCGRLAEMPKDEQMEAIQNWNIGGHKIDYCLSSQRSTKDLCGVEYSYSIMLSTSLPPNYYAQLAEGAHLHGASAVCIINLLKCILISYTWFYHSSPKDRPLTNVGDAICSFLQDPDKTTRGLGIVSKQQISKNDSIWRRPGAHEYQYKRTRWFHAVSWRRWVFCIGLYVVSLKKLPIKR